MSDAPGVARLVDHLFRRSAGEIAAVLLRRSGGLPLEAAEEAVQDAFVQALRRWPWQGIPGNPRGWLYRVAWRKAEDDRAKGRRRSELLVGAWEGGAGEGPGGGVPRAPRELPDPDRVADDELALLLLLCDPGLSRLAQVTLTLKVGCGFSVEEIAAAFLVRPATVAQRCVRAKRLLRERGLRPPEPTADLLAERAPVLREVLYLLFTGGHAAGGGDAAVRGELCAEALRLGRLMLSHPGGDTPATRALMALLCLHAARLPARLDPEGVAIPLEEQDRSRWDRPLLAEGFHHLEASARGTDMTRYHLEAGIAALHARAPEASATDWDGIVGLYDRLLELRPSPVVELNRAVALSRARGPAAGLAAARAVADHPSLDRYHLGSATLATLLEQLGRPEEAAARYREAMALAPTEADRAFLRRKLDALSAGRPPRAGAPPEGTGLHPSSSTSTGAMHDGP